MQLRGKTTDTATEVRSSSDVGSLARGGSVNLLGAVAFAGLNFALVVVLSRNLGAEGSGRILEAIAIFNILSVVGLLGIDTGLVRTIAAMRVTDRSGEIPTLLVVAITPVVLVSGLLALAMYLGAGQIADIFADGDQGVSALLKDLAPLLPVASVYWAFIGAGQAYETMLPTVLIDRLGRPLAQLAFVWLAVVAASGSAILALAWGLPFVVGLAAAGLCFVALFRRARRKKANVAPRSGWKSLAKEFWSFTLPRSLASIFRVAVQWLDVVLVGAMLDLRAAGIYAVSTKLIQLGVFVASSVAQVVRPRFSRLLAQGEGKRARSLYQVATGWQVALTWPQYLIVALFATVLLRALFGTEFAEGAPVVAILALSAMVGAAAGPVDVVLLMAGKSTWSLGNAGLALAMNIGLNLLLIPRFGIVGAALAWAIARVVANLLPLFQVGRSLGFHPFGRELRYAAAGSLLTFGLMALAIRTALGTSPLGLLVAACLSLIFYVAYLVRFRQEVELPEAFKALRPGRPAPTSS